MIVICLLFLLCLLLAGSVSDDQPNDDQPDQPEPPYLVVFNNAVTPCVLSCFFSKLLGRRWETGVQWRCDRSSYDAMTWWLAALFVLVVLMAWEARQGVAGCSADPSLSIRDKHWRTEVNDGPSQTQVANPSQPRPMRNWRVKKLFPPACDTGTSHHVILWVGLATRQPFPFFTSSEKDLSQTAHAESKSPPPLLWEIRYYQWYYQPIRKDQQNTKAPIALQKQKGQVCLLPQSDHAQTIFAEQMLVFKLVAKMSAKFYIFRELEIYWTKNLRNMERNTRLFDSILKQSPAQCVLRPFLKNSRYRRGFVSVVLWKVTCSKHPHKPFQPPLWWPVITFNTAKTLKAMKAVKRYVHNQFTSARAFA